MASNINGTWILDDTTGRWFDVFYPWRLKKVGVFVDYEEGLGVRSPFMIPRSNLISTHSSTTLLPENFIHNFTVALMIFSYNTCKS